MDEIQTDAVLNQRVRGGLSDAEMGKGMTYEESIHKMLERILWNQREMLNVLIGHDRGACCPHTLGCIKETEALLEQVKA